MVLTCDGAKIVASSVDSLFEAHPRLQLEAELLAQKKKRHVRPEGVLYARQKVNTYGKSKKPRFFILARERKRKSYRTRGDFRTKIFGFSAIFPLWFAHYFILRLSYYSLFLVIWDFFSMPVVSELVRVRIQALIS